MKNKKMYFERVALEKTLFSMFSALRLSCLLLFALPLVVSAEGNKSQLIEQQKTVSGVVLDNFGDPLIGVSVSEKGTTNGTMTDLDGKYSINIAGEKSTLIYSFIGFATKEIIVGSQTSINIRFEEDTKLLDEVVVVSYGTQKKRDMTGSIASVNADNLSDLPVGQIAQKLQGQIAGVQVNQSSGIPGQGMSFNIRGAVSINNSNQPLFIVDGIPISTGLNNINPDEIETFSVLKDASATALYGSRAGNGVILITTKRGKLGKTSVTFHANYGIQTLSGLKEMDVMNAHEFAKFKKEIFEEFGPEVPEMYQNPDQYIGKGTNWYKELTRTAPVQSYTLSLSGGKDKFTSAVSLGYFKQEGVVKNSQFERVTLRANSDYEVNKKIKIGLNIAPMLQLYQNQNTDGDRQVLSAALIADPCQNPYDENGELTTGMHSPGMFGQPNWIRYLDERQNKYKVFTLLSNVFADVDIWNGIKYRFQGGVDLGFRRQRVWTPSTSAGNYVTQPPGKARGEYNSETYYNWTAENMLTYNKDFGDHSVGALLGYTSQKYSRDWGNLNGTDYADDVIPWIDAAKTKNGGSGITEWSIASFIGRANYSYKNRYLLQGTIRRDGSSRFGPGNKYANFPSVSAGWIASEESFMKPLTNVMNYLKLRASWGVTGNYNIGDYSYIGSMVSGDYVLDGTLAPGRVPGGIGNDKLTWEETKQFDFGVDFGFLNDRVFLMYDYYNRRTNGLLYQTDIPWTSGFGSITSNMGVIDSWGHEFSIESRNLIGEFTWKTNLNMTFSRNKVVGLSTNGTPIGGDLEVGDWNRLQIGKPVGVFMGYVFDGVYMTQEEFDSQPKHSSSAIGTVRMKDINSADGSGPDGKIDIYDREIIGDPNPDMTFGITNEFAWKNFDLSVLFTGQIGGDIYMGVYENVLNLDGVFNVLKDVENRWRSPEEPGNGLIPRARTGAELYRLNHSGWVYDATHLTLKNVTLGYNIPFKPNDYISKARVYFSAQQLFTITDYPGINPQISTNYEFGWRGQGVDKTMYPIPRTFSIGCNITF